MHLIYTTYGCRCSPKKLCIHWVMVGCNYFLERKKLCTLKKTSLRLITVTYKETYSFRNKQSTLDHSLLLWVCLYDFTKIFVRLSVIAAVCYFSVYKLIGWDSKSSVVHKLIIKRVESRPGVFVVNLEHISQLFFSVLLLTLNR